MLYVLRCFGLCHLACTDRRPSPWKVDLLFTLASLSLPYADDVPAKMKKRILATLAGGLISVVIYALIPAAAGRTATMMLSGYLSFYFKDYVQTFACSTIGALGGAVFMNAFGFQAVSSIFLIRLLGTCWQARSFAYIFNCLILPYNFAKATQHLMKKYNSVTEFLVKTAAMGYRIPSSIITLSYRPTCRKKNSQNTRLTPKPWEIDSNRTNAPVSGKVSF